MKKAIYLAGLLSVGCLMMTGCQRFAPEVTGISISDKNVVRQVIKENFDASGYSEEELTSQIEYEINAYNDKAEVKSVKSNKLKIKDGVAEITLTYATPKDFAAFNNEDFYVGDMYGAIQNGYTFQGAFQEVEDGAVVTEGIWGSKLMSSGENFKTVVVSEPTAVQVPGKIKYISDNMKISGPSIAVAETSDLSYIMYE